MDGKFIVNASGCHTCHGVYLSGGKSPDPSAVNAPNLTPGGELNAWSEDDFIKAIPNKCHGNITKISPMMN
jgi:hypothetical protein